MPDGPYIITENSEAAKSIYQVGGHVLAGVFEPAGP